MDDDDDLIVDDTEEEEAEVVEASPWTNTDTVAAVFAFASSIADAQSDFFKSLNRLALAQAGIEWKKYDKAEFMLDADHMIKKLTEGEDG